MCALTHLGGGKGEEAGYSSCTSPNVRENSKCKHRKSLAVTKINSTVVILGLKVIPRSTIGGLGITFTLCPTHEEVQAFREGPEPPNTGLVHSIC